MSFAFILFALIAFYVSAIPVKIALHLRIGEKIHFSSGVAIFEARFADRLADKHAQGRKKPPFLSRWIKNAEKRRRLLACSTGLRHFYHHIKLESLYAGGRLSLSDAAHTALLCGSARALAASLRSFTHVYFTLQPDFSAGHSDAIIRGMFSIRAGHIILAVIEGIAHYIKEEYTQWKSTRLKTS